MITEIRVPIRPGGGSAYRKVERRAGDWADRRRRRRASGSTATPSATSASG